MGIAYDLVRVVTPDAARHCSYPAGRRYIRNYPTEADALAAASLANAKALLPGIDYVVVTLDELDPARAQDDPDLAAEWAACG